MGTQMQVLQENKISLSSIVVSYDLQYKTHKQGKQRVKIEYGGIKVTLGSEGAP